MASDVSRDELSYAALFGVTLDSARKPLLLLIKRTPDDQLEELAEAMGLSREEYRRQVQIAREKPKKKRSGKKGRQ